MIRDQISILIATHNRAGELRQTLGRLKERVGELPKSIACEVWVVDNSSTDDTRDMVLREFGWVKLIANRRNDGPVAKNIALDRSRGEWVLFLDDDSSPTEGSIERAISHLKRDQQLGCVSFDAVLPDGTHEASAYPDVFIGCGAMFRREALKVSGGLPAGFFMQAEEYDLSLRLMNAGYRLERRVDCVVEHRKSNQSRCASRTMRLDVRNNLLVLARNMPAERLAIVAPGWLRRYWWMARMQNRRGAFVIGLVEGLVCSAWALLTRRRAVSEAVADQFFMTQEIRQSLAGLTPAHLVMPYEGVVEVPTGKEGELRPTKLVVIGLGKNAVEVIREARELGMEVVAVLDEAMAKASRGGEFAGVAVVGAARLEGLRFDAAIVGHASPVQAEQVIAEFERQMIEHQTKRHRLPVRPVPVLNPMSRRRLVTDVVRAEVGFRQTVAHSVSRAA